MNYPHNKRYFLGELDLQDKTSWKSYLGTFETQHLHESEPISAIPNGDLMGLYIHYRGEMQNLSNAFTKLCQTNSVVDPKNLSPEILEGEDLSLYETLTDSSYRIRETFRVLEEETVRRKLVAL